MSTESRASRPYTPDSINELSLDWVVTQLNILSNIVSGLSDCTGHIPKYKKITESVDGTSYTAGDNEFIIFCDTDGTGITLNLPAGVNQNVYRIKNIGASNNVVVTPNGSETIDGAASKTLGGSKSILIMYIAEDTDWYILSDVP